MNKKESGFTLIEIAIVLVIVGLLLGGVLKGQSLITNAKVGNLIKQMQTLQVAVYAFQDQYNAVPGDMSNASTIVSPEAVNCTWNCDNGRINLWRNGSLVFNHLSAAGLYSGQFADSEVNAQPSTTRNPTNPFGGPIFIGYTGAYGDLLTSGVPAVTLISTGANVPASILAQIDRKIDDGKPLTGSFRSGWPHQNQALCIDRASNTWRVDGRDNCAGALLF